jgi:hypothetical protein
MFAAGAQEDAPRAELIQVRKIWDRAPHNAFTDLIRWNERWYCVFREGAAHVSPDGALRVITSADGEEWASAALIMMPKADLRDAKIAVTPSGRLMLTGAAAWHQPAPHRHQSFAWFSTDGRDWGEAVPIGEPDMWLWRATWRGDTAYGVGYSTNAPPEERLTRLYRSTDGTRWQPLVDRFYTEGYPNEHALVFLPDGTACCLLRRDGGTLTGQLGTAKPPYRQWSWRDLGKRIGGPQMVRLPDGRLIAAVRLHDGKVRTGICRVDPAAGTLTEMLTLPSGGDTSYAGLVYHGGVLWVSYYSSHEGKTAVYLARVRL